METQAKFAPLSDLANEALSELESQRDAAVRREETVRREMGVAHKKIERLESELAIARKALSEAEAERDAGRLEVSSQKAAAVQPEQSPSTETQLPVSTHLQPNVEGSQDAPDSSARQGGEAPLAVEPQSTKLASLSANSGQANSSDKRHDRRVPSRFPATYWRAGMTSASSCTIRDMSTGGAKLQLESDGVHSRMKKLAIGDQLTLSIETSVEQSSVVCIVMWVAGNRCGVRFSGQFHNSAKTTSAAPNKYAVPKAPSGNILQRWRSSAH